MNIPKIEDGQGANYSNFNFFKKGGMGEIYKGVEVGTGKEAVLKLILIGSQEEKSLLETEIHVSEKLVHPNISKTLKTGEIEIDGNRYLFIIQEYYPNGNMRYLLKENTPVETCITMMLEILYGMKEIHKIIVHRDLKPENILVDSEGHLLLTDFGLAKYIDEKTRTRSFKGYGTVPYMAPECWTGDTNTKLMDIYSLGLIFFEIITGRPPVTAKTELDWREFHLFTPLPNISTFRPGITIKFNQILQKMSNKRANERYRSIDEIIEAVSEAAKINAAEASEAERLARLGNVALQIKKTEQLKAEQEREKADEWIKFLNYQTTELFNNVVEKVNTVNERLEDGKIQISKKPSSVTTARGLLLLFCGKSIRFDVIDSNLIEKYEMEREERSLKLQRQQYGDVMYRPEDSFLRTNKIVLIGFAGTTFKIGNSEYGFNLILKKLDGSNYGEWHIMQFSKNSHPPETSFGLDLSIFFRDYEKYNGGFYTRTFRKLSDDDIHSLLEKIF
jgi:serine/threonine protein kinase